MHVVRWKLKYSYNQSQLLIANGFFSLVCVLLFREYKLPFLKTLI